MNKLVESIEKEYKKKKVQFFKVGDTVKVHTKIIEGDKERVQVYNGVVVGRKGVGISETFTVNRVAFGYANEKVFSLHSPSVEKIEVVARGDVRQSKLGYIRGKVGKKSKVRSKVGGKKDSLYDASIDDEAVEDAAAREDVVTEDKAAEMEAKAAEEKKAEESKPSEEKKDAPEDKTEE